MELIQSSFIIWVSWILWLCFYIAQIWICLLGKKNFISKGWNFLIAGGVVGILDHFLSLIPGLIAYRVEGVFTPMKITFQAHQILRDVHLISGTISSILVLYGLYLISRILIKKQNQT